MKLNILLVAAAFAKDVDPIKDVVRRLTKLEEWGTECADNLIPPAKNNVKRKLWFMNKVSTKFYNKHNQDTDVDLNVDEVWADVQQRKPSTSDPCSCLAFIAKAYTNFFNRGFPNTPHTRQKANVVRVAGKLKWRLGKTYGC